jgi:hypothetical protein
MADIRTMKLEGPNGEDRQVEVIQELDTVIDGGILTIRGDGRRLRLTGELLRSGKLYSAADCALIERVEIKHGARVATYSIAKFLP